MTEESTLVDIAEDVGTTKTCIKAIKDRLDKLEERPCIPRWVAKWFNTLTISAFVAIISIAAVSLYRLGQVETSCAAIGVKYDRLVYAISVELSQSQSMQPEVASVSPSIIESHPVVHQDPTRLTFSSKPDNAAAKLIYSRLMATVNGATKL